MVKKLKILAITLLLSLTSFSQTDTSKVCLPYHIAKLIAIDLVQGDSVKSELKQTQKLINVYQDKIDAQDSINTAFEKKEIEHKSEIKIFEEKEKYSQEKIKELKESNDSLVKKNKNLKSLSQWLGGGLIAIIVTIVTYSSIK